MIHVVQAQGGAVLIQTDSFSLADGETVQDANVSATLVLQEGTGASANVSILLLVESMEGGTSSAIAHSKCQNSALMKPST